MGNYNVSREKEDRLKCAKKKEGDDVHRGARTNRGNQDNGYPLNKQPAVGIKTLAHLMFRREAASLNSSYSTRDP